MKKLFTLCAAVLTAMSMSAVSGLWQFPNQDSAPAVNSKLTGTNIQVEFLTTDASKSFSVENVGYVAEVPAELKALGKKGLKLGGNALYLKLTPIDASAKFAKGDTILICGFNPLKISSTSAQAGDIAASLATGAAKDACAVARIILTADVEALYIMRATGAGTDIAAIKVAGFVDKGDPILDADKESLNLKIARTGVEQKQDSFVLSGIHLDKVAKLDLEFPAHAGLSIDQAEITPEVDGSLTQKFIVTYAPEVEEESFSGEIVVTADDIVIKIAVECNIKVPQAELVDVEDDITWDFAATGLTSTAAPISSEDTLIFFNVAEGWAADFAADKLAGKGQFFFYKDYNCYQGKLLRFNTINSGKLSVIYSNTGNRTAEAERRFVTINGVKTGDGSMSSKEKDTIANIAVEAGEVAIGGILADDSEQALRIYKVAFVKDAKTAIENTEATETKAIKVIRDGQIVILKNGKTYNALGAEIK